MATNEFYYNGEKIITGEEVGKKNEGGPKHDRRRNTR